jgi:AraC-like DNA-binding protein
MVPNIRMADSATLGPVLAAADELATCSDTDVLLRRAVEMARERLGLERVGLFLSDPNAPNPTMRGTWGTGTDGRTTDEHSLFHDGNPTEWEQLCGMQQKGALWQQHEGVLHCDEEPERSIEIGRGWLAVTPLVAGRELIGVMYNDTAVTRADIDPIHQVRAAVYCGLLAGLLLPRRSRFSWPAPRFRAANPLVDRVLSALDRNPRMSGERLAQELSVSAGYLARSFKSEMGVSLVDYRNQRLMDRFFNLVERDQGNLLTAALGAGFNSYTQFHRVYRKMFGQSPREHLSVRAARAELASRNAPSPG